MTLYICTSSTPELIKKTFGASLKDFRPDVPVHKFIPWADGVAIDVPLGDVALVAGTKALAQLQAAGIAPKGRTVTSLRETPLKAKDGGWYMVTFDPGVLASEPDKRHVMDWDLRLAVRLMQTGSLEPPVGDYRWVRSFAETIAWIEAKYAKTKKPVDVSMDTETMGLYPWYADKDFVSISFTAKPNTSEMLYLGPQAAPIALDHTIPLFDQIKWLLTSHKVRLRGANLKFDLNWIFEKWGIECTNFKFDTMLVSTLLNENMSNSLNLHAKVFTPIGGYDDRFNASVDKSRMELVDPEKLRVYQGGDTDACQQVADQFRDKLCEDHKLANFYVTILHPAARAFEKVERRGVLVDQQKMAVLRDELIKVVAESQVKQLEILPNAMRLKYRDRIDKQLSQGKNPMLPTILNEFFFTPHGLNLKPKEFTPKSTKEDPTPSMKKSHLRQFAASSQAASAMIDAMTIGDSAAKTLSTFVEGFLKHLRPDGRFHPSYMLFKGGFNDDEDDDSGTVTGRLSAKEPAIQTLPKKTKWAKRLRECYPAPKGKTCLSVDYSQGELKVVACVAPEKTMIASYEAGLDLHAVTGAKLAGVELFEFLKWKENDDETLAAMFEKHRGNAKPANFGLLYGMGAEGFLAYAWANYGIKLSLAEATLMRNAFFELYPGLIDYHENQRTLVKKFEEVRSPLGRIRHLPTIRSWDRKISSGAERQAINSPIQSCLSDMLCWAIALIENAFPNGEIEIVAMIHDAMIAYVPEGQVDFYAGQIVQLMSNLPLEEVGWQPQLKFTADAEAGPDLAHMKKLKLAA